MQPSRVLRSVRWITFSSAIRIALQFGQVAILARILSPADFGVMAMVGAITSIAALFADLGVGKALFHQRHISHEVLSCLYWFNVLASFGLSLALWLLAAPVAAILNEPALRTVLLLSGFSFPLGAVGYVFRVLAEKELAFGMLALNDILAAIAGFCTAILVAFSGGGVLALVASVLAASAVQSALSCLLLPTRFRPSLRFRVSEASSFLRLGSYTMGEGGANALHAQSDIILGGALLNASTLGIYSLPRDLCLRVGMVINPIITRVSLPVMAQVNFDPSLLQDVYLKTLRMTASLNAPLYCALIVFAEEVVGMVYGDRWASSVPLLRLMAVWGLLRSVGNPVGSLIYAQGAARRAFWWNTILLICFPPILWFGTAVAGVDGLAWALVGAQVALIFPIWRWLVHPLCGASFWRYLVQPALPLLLAAVTGIFAFLATRWIDAVGLRLGVGLGLGSLLYLMLSRRFNRIWWAAMIGLLIPYNRLATSSDRGHSG